LRHCKELEEQMAASMSWEDFRLVKAISDARSLVGAAESLNLNHSTVFRRLGALEETIGTRLFERARAGYEPTAAGEEMIKLASRMDQDIVDFERKIAGRDVKPAGDLRVATNDTLLIYMLTPVFAGFRIAYPDIRVDVAIGNQSLNLSKRDADVAVRATLRPPETLVGRRIADFAWARYAARSWLEKRRPVEGDDVPWIGFGEALSHISASRWINQHVGTRRVVYRVDTVLGLAGAIEAEIGVGLLPCFIGDRSPGVVRLGLQTFDDPMESLWLLTHPDMRNSARVRAFMDFAGAELARQKALIEGGG
jgi:DNA-binding transcriptional LysR family regulator